MKIPAKLILFTSLIIVHSLIAKAQKTADYPADLMQLHTNVWSDILKNAPEEDNVKKITEKLSDQGAWPDVDYASKQRGDWHPATHLSRLQSLAKAWQKEGSSYYHDPALLQKIHSALNYWLNNDFQCPNWWYPEIGVPMSLGPTLILMEKELSKEQMALGIKILDRAKIRMTGQNKVWLSGNVLLKSMLLRDTETIRKASASIQEELKVSLEEGIQPDGSFHQHGPQIQFGNYGLAYVGDMIKWIRILRNTPYNFDESKMAILRNYLMDGQQWIVWKNQMDISACGRQLFIDAQMGKAKNLAGFLRQMEALDPAYADVYKKANQYESLIGNKHFYSSDFQIQRSPEYYFSVKMCSERVIGAESCNSENIRGYYLGDGATYLYQTGKEYENIFPYWDWKKIPGTTTLQDDKELPVLTASGYRIKSDFVGGVSDGKDGIAVMDYNRNGITAKKSWFNFSNRIICLGSGINSSEANIVTTTVNQAFLKGEVTLQELSGKIIAPESSITVNPKWILHDNTGYYFPDGGNLKLETRTITGSWNQVALMYKNEPIMTQIFKLWYDHGAKPENQKYAYFLVPGATKAILGRMEKNSGFNILKNDTELQAVVASDGYLGGAIFYKSGKINLSGGVEVDKPCVIMVKREKKTLLISISDPTQKLTQIRLTLDGKYETANPAAILKTELGKSILDITLPRGGEAGKTVSLKLRSFSQSKTVVSIKNDDFYINNEITLKGRKVDTVSIEGLLPNSRMVQGIFDDLNPDTRNFWKYPDTGKWDPDRNTNEFVSAMPEWRAHGLLAFTLNLQGGSPTGYGNKGWINPGFFKDGKIMPDYFDRLERILNKADQLGMVVILGIFYFGQDENLENETAVKNAVNNTIDWLFAKGYRNVLIEINNECNVNGYDHDILKPDRVSELIELAKNKKHPKAGYRFYVSTSYGGKHIPHPNVVKTADFLLLHGNGADKPEIITQMVADTKKVEGYHKMPILFNEDDHYNFNEPVNNMLNAFRAGASWGLFDFRKRGETLKEGDQTFKEGYQSVPVEWAINSQRKKDFFELLARISGL